MRLFTLLLLTLIISIHANAGKKLKVLFIGNSYTYVNNLPQITADVAASMGDTLVFDSYTVGGYRFADHAIDTNCINKIRSAKWDYVILQEQSQQPSQPTSGFFTYSYHWAWYLDTIIETNDPCTKTMFYMTWGYKDGDSSSCTFYSYVPWPYVCTYEGMDSLTRLRYRAYADTSLPPAMGYPLSSIGWFRPIRPTQVSPVGAVRHYIRHNYPTIELYQSDGSHPTQAGSYAGACTFYVALFHKDPTLIPYNYTLSTTDAANIKTAAKIVAYDSMSYWHIGQYDLRAMFDYTPLGGNAVEFTDHSTNATSYTWYFGDGSSSTLSSPSHTYATTGAYMVRLIVSNGSCYDTTYMVVNSYPASIGNVTNQKQDFTIFPNPVNDILNINSVKFLTASYQVNIYNTIGQLVYSKENRLSQNQTIDMSRFNKAVYFITIVNNGRTVYSGRFIK